MSAILATVADAPTLWIALVVASTTLLVAFGVPLTEAQGKAVVGLTAAFLALAGGILSHRSTTPNAHVDAIVRTVTAPQASQGDTPPAVQP